MSGVWYEWAKSVICKQNIQFKHDINLKSGKKTLADGTDSVQCAHTSLSLLVIRLKVIIWVYEQISNK